MGYRPCCDVFRYGIRRLPCGVSVLGAGAVIWFVMVSPGTFLLIMFAAFLGSLLMVVLNAIEDSDIEAERRYRLAHPRTPEQLAEEVFPGWLESLKSSADRLAETELLLKRLAETRQ